MNIYSYNNAKQNYCQIKKTYTKCARALLNKGWSLENYLYRLQNYWFEGRLGLSSNSILKAWVTRNSASLEGL